MKNIIFLVMIRKEMNLFFEYSAKRLYFFDISEVIYTRKINFKKRTGIIASVNFASRKILYPAGYNGRTY